MRCEVCGRETNKLYPVIIEGVEMMVCDECKKFGKLVKKKKKATPIKKVKKIVPYSKDVFQNMDKDLIPGWGEKIKVARELKKWSREQLGAKVGEKTNTIAKIENEELRPPDETVKKIEKALDIQLFQKIEDAVIKKKKARNLTLGDLLKKDV